MAEKKWVAWDENGGFRNLKAFEERMRTIAVEWGMPPTSLGQWAEATKCISPILCHYYGKVWMDKYGVVAEELIKQGILDK